VGARSGDRIFFERWLDAGVVVNFNYNSVRADPYRNYNDNTRYHIFNYGVSFCQAYPLPFLFVTAQPEYNWIHGTATYMGAGGGEYSIPPGIHAVAWAGYGQRVVGQSSFYIALMFDVLGNRDSPYNDFNGHPLPVIRAGFNVYLHQR